MTDNRLAFGHRKVLRGARFVCADCGTVLGDLRVAASFRKLHKEKYFQTPEGRAALEMVERRYPHDKRVTPWLLREYRRGRLVVTPQWQEDINGLIQSEKDGDEAYTNYYNQRLNGDRPDIVFFEKLDDGLSEEERMQRLREGEQVPQPPPVQPGMVQNLIQMLDYFEKRNKPIDIMGKSLHELKPEYESWKQNYRPIDPDAGEVIHSYPNGWTMRRVQGRDELFNEGEEMQNCVPKYVDNVAQGTHHLFSLRDHKNDPHANVLMVPSNQGQDWRDGGSIVDIRGKQNATPLPDYQRYIRDWIGTFPNKPTAAFEPGPAGDPGPGNPEDYGLDTYRYGKRTRRQPGWQVEGARIDMLRNPDARADLQSPEAQEFLNMIEHTYHTDKNDYLMPFLVKEWKAGRLIPNQNQLYPASQLDQGQYDDTYKSYLDYFKKNGYDEPERRAKDTALKFSLQSPLTRHGLGDMVDFLRSGHPKSRLDLSDRNTTWDDLADAKTEYDHHQRRKRDKQDIVHKGPNGSYIKALRPDELQWEGDQMGNCIREPQYDRRLNGKQGSLFSVRDKNGNPHVDIEMKPRWLYNKETGEKHDLGEPHSSPTVYPEVPQDMVNDPNWVSVPQQAGIVQIQGKENAPPHERYAPLVKDWMQSRFFQGEDGEDWRPQWSLHRKHFDNMADLYSPVRQHVMYYHPGDYGIEDPGVTSDYKGLVKTLANEITSDRDHKRLPFLVDWARRHGELGDLLTAVKDPQVHEYHKAAVGRNANASDDPEYAKWLEENSRPERQAPTVPCNSPVCAGTHRTVYEDGWADPAFRYRCDSCGKALSPEEGQAWKEQYNTFHNGYEDWLNGVYKPWEDENTAQYQAAQARQAEPMWEASKNKEMLDRLYQQAAAVDQNDARGQAVVASVQYPCTCGLHREWRDVTASLLIESNQFNKVRNMLRKQDQYTPENEAILEHLRYAYPNHDKLAEWLHREVRKERLDSPVKSQAASIESYMERAEKYYDEAQGFREQGNNQDADSYERASQQMLQQMQEWRDQLNDPEWLADQRLTHYDDQGGKTTQIDPETLDAIQSVHKKRKQRGTNETNLMKIPIGELIEEAREEAMAQKARDAGTVVHKFNDGWTMRHLDTADEADLESEMLGHCINQYRNEIQNGTSHNYSLRDPKGMAHVTLEIKHKRPESVDWNSLRENTQEGGYACPSCGHLIGKDGRCSNCGFDMDTLKEWHEKPLEEQAQFNEDVRDRLHKEINGGEEPEETHLAPHGDLTQENNECPNCGAGEGTLENRARNTNAWFCRTCHHVFWKTGEPDVVKHGEGWDGEISGDGRHGRLDPRPKGPSDWWSKARPELHESGLLKPDFREGDAYQIQGKENVAPKPKYHRYIKEWMRSIPYDERPKATWSSYFTKTPVLHVNDLELGGEKGEDDFGFAWRDRPYKWSSIVNSLHGKPKQWAAQRGYEKKFEEENTPDEQAQYRPELGNRLYEFAKKNGHLEDLMKEIGPWGVPDKPLFRNLGDLPCAACGQKGYLHRDPNKPGETYCAYCGEHQETSNYEEQLPPTPEPRAQYEVPYQGQMVQHLGPQLAQHPEIEENLEQWVPEPGGAAAGGKGRCPNCGRSDSIRDHYPYTGYAYCDWCGTERAREQFRIASRADQPQLHVGYHGQPCYCGWHSIQRRHAAAFQKVADKFNDYLMNQNSRPDLQTEEAQNFLGTLRDNYLNPETDELTPWLVREWKKGRLYHPRQGLLQYTGPEDYEYEGPNGEPTRVHGLAPAELNHWAQWYRSDHPTRRGVDVMQLGTPDFVSKVRDWDQAMKEQAEGAAGTKGKVEHTYPDNWSVQRLQTEKQLKDEGEKMGHCVGGYFPAVRDQRSLIYSLRDHHNEPHATWEITPRHHECPGCGEIVHPNTREPQPGGGTGYVEDPHVCGYVGETTSSPKRGTMVQIQGKGNESPIDEYQQRLKEYFHTFPADERPEWDDRYVGDLDDLDPGYQEYHEGDYGLNEPNVNYDWEAITDDLEPGYGRYGMDSDDVVHAAEEAGQGEIQRLSDVVEGKYQQAEQAYKDHAREQIEEFPEQYFDHSYGEEEPKEADFETPEEYEKAYEVWEEERGDWISDNIDDLVDTSWHDSDEGVWWNNFESEVSNALYRARRAQRQGSWRESRRRPHVHYTTGKPCNCTFTKHLKPQGARIMLTHQEWTSKVLRCEVCGDPLDGAKCKRCNWGGWSNAMDPTENPSDPTQDLKPAIQA